MYTLDQYVENDYSLIYFHYGLTSKNKPSMSWLWQAYKTFDRKLVRNLDQLILTLMSMVSLVSLNCFYLPIIRYKKNLKALYLVHPTNFIKVIWQLFKPVLRYFILVCLPVLLFFINRLFITSFRLV